MTDFPDIFTHVIIWHLMFDSLLMADRRLCCSWISADVSPNNPPLPHPDRVVKIMATENRSISKSFFMCELSGCHTSHELNTWGTSLNIKLSGGEAWVSSTNHHHIVGDEETCHSCRKTLFYYLDYGLDKHLHFWTVFDQSADRNVTVSPQSRCENASLTQTTHITASGLI